MGAVDPPDRSAGQVFEIHLLQPSGISVIKELQTVPGEKLPDLSLLYPDAEGFKGSEASVLTTKGIDGSVNHYDDRQERKVDFCRLSVEKQAPDDGAEGDYP
jgi:hypothetical protein